MNQRICSQSVLALKLSQSWNGWKTVERLSVNDALLNQEALHAR